MPVKHFIPGVGVVLFDDGTSYNDALRMAGRSDLALPDQAAPADDQYDFARGLGSGFTGAISSLGSVLEDVPVEGVSNFGRTIHEGFGGISEHLRPRVSALGDINGVGDAIDYAQGVAGQVVGGLPPYIAAGALAGTPGVIGYGTGVAYGQIRDVQRETGVDDKLGAGAAALGSGTLDAGLGIGRLLPGAFGPLAEQTSKNLLRTGVRVGVEEAGEEAAQQVLQRAGAHQDLTSPEAFGEYVESAVQGAIGGGVVGAAVHPFQHRALPDNTVEDRAGRGESTDLLGKALELPAGELDLGETRQVPLNLDHQVSDNPLHVDPSGTVMSPDQANVRDQFMQNQMPGINQALQSDAFDAAAPGTQGDIFSYNEPVVGELAPRPGVALGEDNGAQLPLDQDGLPVEGQTPEISEPGLFDKGKAGARSQFGPREILQRLQGLVGEGSETKRQDKFATPMDSPRPRDAFVYKTFSEINRNLANNNAPALEGYILDQRQELESANIKPATIDLRNKVLDAAQTILDDYRKAVGARAPRTRAKTPAPEMAAPQIDRAALLQKALTVPGLRNPTKYFEAQLKRNNLPPQLTDDEFDQLFLRQEQGTAALPREPKAAKVKAVKEKVQTARKKPVERPQRAKPNPTAAREVDQEASEQVKEAKPAVKRAPKPEPPREDVVTPKAEPDGVETARELGRLNKTIDDALKTRQISATDRMQLKQLVRNGAEPTVVQQAIEDAKSVHAGRVFNVEQNKTEDLKKARQAPAKPSEGATRRDVLKTIGALAVAGVTARPNIARASTTSAPLTAAIRAGDHNTGLKVIATQSRNPLYRNIASKLLKGGMGNTVLLHQRSINPNLYGTTNATPEGNSDVVLFEPQGFDEETFLHEMLHAYVMQRWGSLAKLMKWDPATRHYEVLPTAKDPAVAAFRDMANKLSDTLVKRLMESGSAGRSDKLLTAEWQDALTDPDEMLSWVMTNPDIQAFMRTVDPEGKPVAKSELSVWESFVKFIKNLLGIKYIPPAQNNAFNALLRAGEEVLDRGAAVPADGKLAGQIAAQSELRKNMYTGVGAIHSEENHGGLIQATVREAAGQNVGEGSAVHRETGWFKPKDGKWRFEISDVDASVNEKLWAKMPTFGPAATRLQGVHLRDLLTHDQLYDLYPGAGDIKIARVDDLGKGVEALFNPQENTILVAEKNPTRLKGLLLHETQHWIQEVEDFARGGSTGMALSVMPDERIKEMASVQIGWLDNELKMLDVQRGWLEEHRDLVDSWLDARSRYFVAKDIDEDNNTLRELSRDEMRARHEVMEAVVGTSDIGQLSNDGAAAWKQFRKEALDAGGINSMLADNKRDATFLKVKRTVLDSDNLKMVRGNLDPTFAYEAYRSLLGEVEAFATQNRVNMSADDRRTLNPRGLASEANPDTHVVFRGGSKPQSAIAAPFVERNVEKLPVGLQNSAYTLTDFFKGKTAQAVARVALGPKLAEVAAKAKLPSAKVIQRLNDERNGIAERTESKFLELTERFDSLPKRLRGRGGNTINGLAKEMVTNKAWAFKPTWLKDQDGKPITVPVDLELADRFNALPANARQVMEDMFRLTHETLHRKWDTLKAFVEGEHSAMIADAQDKLDRATKAGADAGELAKLTDGVRKAEAARDAEMARYHKLFTLDLSIPYSPIRRFGHFVVVGRSREFLVAEEEARATDDTKSLDKLKTDPNHYFVDFAETRAQAEHMKRLLAQSFGNDIEVFTRDKSHQELFGGRDMFFAFQRLRNLIEDSGGSESYKAKLNGMVTDLLLSTLAETSSRKAEMTRLMVAGGDFDMMRGAVQQGKSDAQFIAALHKSAETLEALRHMGDEARAPGGVRDPEGREKRETYRQEILARHVAGMTPPPPNALADKVGAFTAIYMIATAPAFYVQQLSQPSVMSVPVAAATHGYAPTWRAMTNGYRAVGDAWKNSGLIGSLRIEQLPAELQPLAHFMAERGRLDVGIDKEIGDWTSDGSGPMTDAMRNVVSKLRALTRKTEAINRLATGVMMYNLELKNPSRAIHDAGAYASYLTDFREAHPDLTPMSALQFAAANHAIKIIDDTHGTYDIANAPRFMRGPWQRVIFQFKKFQIMQLQLYAQSLRDGFFNQDIPLAERQIARRMLGYMSGHAAIMAGGLGLPAATVVQALYQALMGMFGDDDERPDAERDLRQAIGDPQIANLLLNGVPSLAGLNLTGSLGQGNILSLAPYADTPVDEKSYNAYITQMLGPAIGGVGRNIINGVDLMNKGETYKAFEKMSPRGLASAMRAVREASEGETNTRGEVTASDIPSVETMAGLLGLNTTSRAGRQFNREQHFEDDRFNDDRSSELKKRYVEAVEAGDRTAMSDVRSDWKKFQDMRVSKGLKRQGISVLIKAPREKTKKERNTVGGVQFTTATRGEAEQLADLTEE